jgi:hypothetical protein
MRKAVLWTGMVCLLTVGCCGHGAPRARHQILAEDAPRAVAIIRDLATRHVAAMKRTAERLAIGFVRFDGAQRIGDMHHALHLLRSARGIPALADPSIAFIAAIDAEGHWMASDREPEPTVDTSMTTQWPAVTTALQGRDAVTGLAELPGPSVSTERSLHWIVAQPARYADKVVGAFILGVTGPELMRLVRSPISESAATPASLVLYRGDQLYNPEPSLTLDSHIVHGAAQREAGLTRSPRGFIADVSDSNGSFAYGVRPVSWLGPDAGIVIVRNESAR